MATITKRLILLAGILLLARLWFGGGKFAAVAAPQSKGAGRQPLVLDRAPVRIVQDPHPTFNGMAMDVERGEIFLADDNRAGILVYGAEFRPTDRVLEPRRQISGPTTHIGHICTLAMSPENNQLFAVDNDWRNNLTVFPMDGKGDIAPLWELSVDHSAYGIFLDRKNDELFGTVQDIHKIAVYRRTAKGAEEPVRYIQGSNTGLADPHGLFVDVENHEIFVTNHGFWSRVETGDQVDFLAVVRGPIPLTPSTGKFLPPSITVHARDARGDARPLRTIAGPRTKLNLPLGIYLDPASRQLVVANAGDNSVLFFDKNASGDAAPARILKGPATGIDRPSGILVDSKRNELWVSNWNNHTATVYARTAEGNAAPLRTLRGAPKGTQATGFGNPGGGVTFDPKRKEILVPN